MDKEIIPQTDIARLLSLINQTNQLIKQLYQAGKTESSMAIRQEKHLRAQYTQALNRISKDYQLAVSAIAA